MGGRKVVYANLIYGFLRLGPLALGAIAIAILTGGYFLQVEMNKDAAAKAVALVEGPPDAVNIAAFDRDVHMSPAREVVVHAQPVLEHAYRLTIERKGTDDHAFMVPLVAADGHSDTEIVGIAYYPSPNEDFDFLTTDFLMRDMVDFGSVGPVIAYNGRLQSMGAWDDLTEEAFFDEGLAMPANPVVVWPYMEGREDALAPSDHGLTVFGLLSKVAGVIGLFALAKVAFRPQNTEPVSDLAGFGAGPSDDLSVAQPATAPNMPTFDEQPVQAASTLPLWKQRSGLYDDVETTTEDQSFAPMSGTSPTSAPQPVHPTFESEIEHPKRKGFGLRKVLTVLVGGMFALGLMTTIVDVIAKSGTSAQVASISTPQERVADVVADAIVPDAPSDRHWTEIDITPAVEWLTAKALLAVTGDTDAMMILGGIAFGVFTVIFGVWWYLVLRRKLTPRTTGRFDSMGIN